MKKKLDNIKPMIIPLMFVGACISFYYIKSTLLGSILLIIFIIFSETEYIGRNNYQDSIEELNININNSINQNIFNLIFPVALIDKCGKIIWSNSKFNKFTEEDPEGLNIVSIARGLNLARLLTCDKDLHQKIRILDCLYRVYASSIKLEESDENVYVVYFNDISNLKNIDNTKESIMLIEVDNLSEALETTSESDRPMLVAEVEKAINTYAQKLKAMITKYDSNKYVLSVQDKYINEEINSKFNILDEISKIDRGNTLEVTLSIGIGRGGTSPQENYTFAVTAKELSLGRGGDQVAVKSNDKITFFGGNSREIEKRTRVRARVIAHALKELIYESSNVFIIGHSNPDMDCFGSAIGLSAVVKQLGKPCNIIINNDTNSINYYLSKIESDEKHEELLISPEEARAQMNDKSLLIIVDVHNKGYIQNLDLAEQANRKIIIDHHRRSPDIIEGAILSYIEVYASSTSEMVTELIQYMVQKPNISRIEAEGLLAGIFMDTKGFSFKAGVRTFDAASFLRALGADTIEVKKMFTDDLDDYLLIADTIKSAELSHGVAIAVTPDRLKESFKIARAADELLNISGIEVCFVIGKINDNVIISGRSIGDINVQVILEAIGGGGHMNMAGAKLTNISVERAKEILKESIKKNLREGE
ncbi:DHH family phosphoesterase [Clostridium septicum]|uniref:Cyclic-di-AMP phosphodiesterase n=1 Tax=Clostridium septicum TaxID=1504 RepID=A0A9N7PLX0_CLOSE|nr:DHH family phosphoesterase [Clostridium septicum]AYE34307.1 DHH family phosphoesterase [Clostridium septicum]MDU1314263.1 DHH family phosphoesterase [Clostridium septicum]QAS59701.1 DHH family phosphoesterase [Clostridium septicum]UEC21055.1 DHH family phosphoesterase [Clostridium septicum]USS00896.1 DHH family phosphoesterase [Clostridium septicum]